jgi:hypothetical protein
MPASVVKMLLDAWSAAAGQPAFVFTSTVAKVTGTPARAFLDWPPITLRIFKAGIQSVTSVKKVADNRRTAQVALALTMKYARKRR